VARKRRGRSEGSIFQRTDGLWVCTLSLGYDGNGKRRRKTVYGKSKAEVQEKLREMQTAADRGTLPDAGSITVGQFLKTWLDAIKPTVAPHTHLAYHRDCHNAIIPHLGGARMAQLTALHVQKLYADLEAAGVSASMRRKAGVTLSVALQYAVTVNLIPHNFAKDVKKPKHTPPEMQVLDLDQVQRFLAEAKADRLFALYALLLDSGAREGEAFGLRWPDVDWAGNAVQVVRALEEYKGELRLKELKTKKSRRRVALSAFAMEALSEHRKAMLAEGNYQADGPIFCDTQGGWLRKSNVLRRSFRPILKRAGLPVIRPYDLRHSSATLLLLAGEDAKVVSERLGHSTTRLTQDTYQHVLPGMQERAASKLDAIFRQLPQQQASS
jgi:integrase